jgi:hypothetical protein
MLPGDFTVSEGHGHPLVQLKAKVFECPKIEAHSTSVWECVWECKVNSSMNSKS